MNVREPGVNEQAEGKESAIVDELGPGDIEELLQELEEEEGVQESLPQEVEELLRDLQPGSGYLARRDAAEQLGKVGTSSPRIVRALIAAQESHSYPVSRAAEKSLRAPVHQEYLQEHPDLMEATEGAVEQGPGKGETGRGRIDPQSGGLIRCMVLSSVAGLVVGLVIGFWHAEQSLFHDGGLTCGTGFLVALTVGAVVGAVVAAVAGGAVQEPTYRILSMIVGAVLAAVVASLSWFPISILRVVLLGGP